jgi:hypothetical protein
MARTVQDILAAVHRKCSGLIPISDIYQSMLNVHRQIYAVYVWPWTYTEANISVAATYSTGTIAITDGTNTVAGTLTVWDTGWQYKKLHFTAIADYPIESFASPTSLTLKQNINTGANWTAAAYTIYQEDYPLPEDCEPGDVLLIVNPQYRYRLINPPRYTQEMYSTALGVTFNSFQRSWSDAGYQNSRYCIRFQPPPGSACEYRVVYRKRVPQLSSLTDASQLPETFDLALEHLTEFEVKRANPKIFPAQESQLAKAEGYQVLQNMRRRATTSTSDIVSGYNNWPLLGGSSMVDATTGLIIQGPVTG